MSSLKRRADALGDATPRDRKKAKLAEARYIPVQNVQLPPTINVEKFVDARAFEINAMENAIKSARDGATHRVFQLLPRHMRRRAASHDIRRIPKGLRKKAAHEYTETTAPKKKNVPKKGFAKRLTKTEEYLRRQRDKSWLETHIWHAKRMHMTTLWGYRLAEKPTAKAFRASHRASMHGAILHDASYFGTIELIGTVELLKKLLGRVVDARAVSPASQRYLNGGRVCDTVLHAPNAYPRGLIGPATVLWRPTVPSVDSRTVWIRVHPATFDDAWAAITKAAGHTLEGTQGQNIEIADLRDELVSFELIGPKGSRVLKGALQPDAAAASTRTEFNDFWDELSNLDTSGSLPRGTVVGFDVLDPRVTFPPKNARRTDDDADRGQHIVWPSSKLAQSQLWDTAARDSIRVPKYSKRDLDARRAKNLIPGTPLEIAEEDARLPILLVQRTLGKSMHGWLVIAPRGWGVHLLHALTYTGTLVAGLLQRATQHAESGELFFPVDFPTTTASAAWWDTRAENERARWRRTPPAKRVAYNIRGVRSAWTPDWTVVLGLGGPRAGESAAQRTEVHERSWLFRGEGVGAALAAADDTSVKKLVADARTKRDLPPLSEAESADLLQTALVSVNVNLVSRGAPGDVGIIYVIRDEVRAQWESGLDAAHNDSMDIDAPDLIELGRVVPPHEDIIGYITSGSYSLTRGCGFGTGAVAAAKLRQIMQRDNLLRTRYKRLVKVRDRNGLICRAATLEIVS